MVEGGGWGTRFYRVLDRFSEITPEGLFFLPEPIAAMVIKIWSRLCNFPLLRLHDASLPFKLSTLSHPGRQPSKAKFRHPIGAP